MASASQKKPTAKRKSTSAKGTSTRTKKPAQPQKQPIRREVWSVALLVLALLSREDMYGYQMITRLEEQSDHTFEMKEGTLYPVLHSLERDGLVEAYQQEARTGRMRKYYHLTRKGGAALRSEAEAWRAYSGAVNAVLRSSPGLNLA